MVGVGDTGEEIGVGEDALDFLGFLVGGGLIQNIGKNLERLNLLPQRKKKC